MKILVVGVYKDGTGYGHYCVHMIRSLIAGGADVVARHVRLSSKSPEIEKKIREALPSVLKEVENKSLANVDIMIQNILPQFFIKNQKCFSVGCSMYETNRFMDIEWVKRCGDMDAIFVPSPQSKDCFISSGVKSDKTHIVNFGINTKELQEHKGKMDLELPPETKVFYFIGDLSIRKFLRGLLQAYYYEFNPWDKVCLVLKGYNTGNEEEDTNRLVQYVSEIKKMMKLNEYPPVIILGGYSAEKDIWALHETCDFFVTASRGESLCLDALTALAKGNPIVVPDTSTFRMYTDNMVGKLIPTIPMPVIGMIEQSPPNLYTGKELWQEPNILCLGNAMRELYSTGQSVLENMKENCKKRALEYDYSETGNKVVKQIEVIVH